MSAKREAKRILKEINKSQRLKRRMIKRLGMTDSAASKEVGTFPITADAIPKYYDP